LGKMKVHEIAKAMGLGTNEVIERLKVMGVEVKSHLSTVDEDVAKKIMASGKNNVPKSSEKTANKDPKENSPHIIRRKVKVISTDEKGNEVENITTKSGNNIERKSIVHENTNKNASYSKEGLGVVKSNRSKGGYNNFRNQNRLNNIVVTKNGKPIEQPKKEEVKEQKHEEVTAQSKATVTNNDTNTEEQ